MVLFKNVCVYFFIYTHKGITSKAPLRSVDGIWLEDFVAFGFVKLVSYRSYSIIPKRINDTKGLEKVLRLQMSVQLINKGF